MKSSSTTRSNRLDTTDKSSKNGARSASAKKSKGVEQTFYIKAPAATRVLLAGDFTKWQDAPIRMEKSSDGVWTARVELPAGTHHYRFLVDGEWHDDPECTLRIENPYGSHNSIREVV
jgi:1,4-alpha-glucan branching enzyme